MKNKKLSLSQIKKVINKMPYGSVIKNDMTRTYKQTRKLIRDSKNKHANPEYYKPRIEVNFMILRNVLGNNKND